MTSPTVSADLRCRCADASFNLPRVDHHIDSVIIAFRTTAAPRAAGPIVRAMTEALAPGETVTTHMTRKLADFERYVLWFSLEASGPTNVGGRPAHRLAFTGKNAAGIMVYRERVLVDPMGDPERRGTAFSVVAPIEEAERASAILAEVLETVRFDAGPLSSATERSEPSASVSSEASPSELSSPQPSPSELPPCAASPSELPPCAASPSELPPCAASPSELSSPQPSPSDLPPSQPPLSGPPEQATSVGRMPMIPGDVYADYFSSLAQPRPSP